MKDKNLISSEIIFDEAWGGVGVTFLTKKSRSQKYFKNIWIDSVFAADSEYDTSFELKCSLWVENVRIPTPKSVKTVPGNNMLRYVPSEQYFLSLKNMQFCSY